MLPRFQAAVSFAGDVAAKQVRVGDCPDDVGSHYLPFKLAKNCLPFARAAARA